MSLKSIFLGSLSFFFLSLSPFPLWGASALPGESLGIGWMVPFVGMLLSIALLPLVAMHFWEHHLGKVVLGWSFLTFLSLTIVFGFSIAQHEILETLLHHYLPFIIMIGALFTISGGVQIDVESSATPLINTGLLAVGTLCAGWIGTTGAAMLFIRPLLQINEKRETRVHHMIFFIFLVANIGGALTPLGDPPLFLGFLNGVSFFWPLEYLALEMVVMAIPLLGIFYLLDTYLVSREDIPFEKTSLPKISVKGRLNGILFLGVMGFVLLSGLWKSSISVSILGVSMDLQNLVRDAGLFCLMVLSWVFTPRLIHQANRFTWEPLKEVIKLFFGIFITVIPVLASLDAGLQGAMGPLVSLVNHEGVPQNAMYFWLTGGLSSFLDNAPTYLVFFHIAGGHAETLMTTLAPTLEAISLGAVFLGAMTYIGNAPNFMVKAIAESHKIKMPSFFGYMWWSFVILLPLFLFLSWWRF